MSTECTGPMPPFDFLAHFLAESRSQRPSSSGPGFNLEKPSEGTQLLSFDLSGLCPGISFSSSPPNSISINASEELMPCLRLYGSSVPHSSAFTSASTFAPQLVDVFVDYVQVDPFRDPGPEVQNRQDVRFQRTSPKAIFASHPRVSLFSIIVTNQGARLLRWDRAGVVVTERFDHNATDSPLAEFLWRLDSMTPQQRGHDSSFFQPTPQEIAIARDAFSRSNHNIPSEAQLYKVSVIDDVTEDEFFLVVSTPQACSDQVHGTASRGYIAVDLRNGSLVWLKDVWRDDHPSSSKEGDTYRRLAEQDVPHIAPLVCAADVPSQATQTQVFAEASWTCVPSSPVGRVHYRIVLGVVGRPLNTFKSTRELCTSVKDATEGATHAKAYKKLNVLHGDISSENILITDDGHGLLIDWELAFDASIGRRSCVIGTWQFVSSRRMDDFESTKHLLSDDLESFLHVLTYIIVHHRPTGVRELLGDIGDVYHLGLEDGSPYMIARYKHSFLVGCTFSPKDFLGYLPKPLTEMLSSLRRLFNHGLYAEIGYVTKQERKSARTALRTPTRVLKLFNDALKAREWPEDDGSLDAVEAFKKQIEQRQAKWEEAEWTGKRTISDAFGDDPYSESSRSAKRCSSCS
ncbi:hypothetical protein OF83DRAFT_1115360 [Amylostereum chailletii]|nr:hypothetical protein OF83DRAFT_1115360 [Amylostereum chailletii]